MTNKTAIAAELADDVVDSMIDELRADPSIPRRTRHEWEIRFGDLRNRFETWICDVIEEAVTEASVED